MRESPAVVEIPPDSTAVFAAIGRRTIVEEFLSSFAQALIERKLRPGQRLPSEPDLARQLGVGRSAVREAMKMLVALGIVNVKKGAGTYIVDRASPDLLSPLVFALLLETGITRELLELRSLLENGYCQLAAQHATNDDWVRIEEAAQAWESLARGHGDLNELTRRDLDFHYAILDATHNSLVIKIGRAIEGMFFASIRAVSSSEEAVTWGIEGHRRIMRAMREGEPEKIRVAVDESLKYWGKDLTQEI